MTKSFTVFREKRSLLKRPDRLFVFLWGELVEGTDPHFAFLFFSKKQFQNFSPLMILYFISKAWCEWHIKKTKFIMIAVRKNLGKETRREMNLMGLFISLLRHLTCFCFLSLTAALGEDAAPGKTNSRDD